MDREIFLPINNDIICNIIEGMYEISNYGRLLNKITNKFIGSYSNKTKRYECSLNLITNTKRYNIDIAKLVYCVFNDILYDGNMKIRFKDNNSNNLLLSNLYDTFNTMDNNIISASDYHIKNKNIMCYFIDERWIDITDKEVKNILPIYKISNYGRVYNKQYGSILYNQISYNGYINAIVKSITGSYINMSIHRTMMKCFHPIQNCDEFEVNHIDSNSLNNNLSNLEWITPSMNEQLMLMNNKNNNKLSIKEVKNICRALECGMSFMEIALYVLNTKYTGRVHANISNIKRRITYTEISKNYNF